MDESDNKNESKKNYAKFQLENYINRLNEDFEPIKNHHKPDSLDPKEWASYLKVTKKKIEITRIQAEWPYIGTLFEYTFLLIQESKKKLFTTEELRKKWVKDELMQSTSNDLSESHRNRYKQVYDHLYNLIKTFEENEISMNEWFPLLQKTGITFRFLHDSNGKKKDKDFKETYEIFINLIIKQCKKN
ncbi:17579_t:CDS:2 [Racocetra persica]|uniref:17579_t:CDS:1 n=1 Tax=Racocetra persica TaxID=160502 RepID=A0ACA9S236_9GLOM|nr:17579_t:CDS:2 [Racocetra persica]